MDHPFIVEFQPNVLIIYILGKGMKVNGEQNNVRRSTYKIPTEFGC